MSRSIDKIAEELKTVKIRLQLLSDEYDLIDAQGKRMAKRMVKLTEELEEAKNA